MQTAAPLSNSRVVGFRLSWTLARIGHLSWCCMTLRVKSLYGPFLTGSGVVNNSSLAMPWIPFLAHFPWTFLIRYPYLFPLDTCMMWPFFLHFLHTASPEPTRCRSMVTFSTYVAQPRELHHFSWWLVISVIRGNNTDLFSLWPCSRFELLRCFESLHNFDGLDESRFSMGRIRFWMPSSSNPHTNWSWRALFSNSPNSHNAAALRNSAT